MEMIERYIKEVERNLPKKLRADVSTELRSAIEDALEARAAQEKEADREQILIDILREFGPPKKFARSYLPEDKYLIGPRYYSTFITTYKICLFVAGGLLILALMFFLRNPRTSFAESVPLLIMALGRFPSTALTLLGIVTVIFALIERFSAPEKAGTSFDPASWDPATLPPVKDPSRINRTGLIAGMCIYVLLFLLINFFPEYIGVFYHRTDSGWNFVSLLSPAFKVHLPWLNVWLILSFALNYVVLRIGRWKLWTRIGEHCITALEIVILYRIIVGAPIIAFKPEWLDSTVYTESFIKLIRETLFPMLNGIVRVGLVVLLGLLIIQAVKRIHRQFAG